MGSKLEFYEGWGPNEAEAAELLDSRAADRGKMSESEASSLNEFIHLHPSPKRLKKHVFSSDGQRYPRIFPVYHSMYCCSSVRNFLM